MPNEALLKWDIDGTRTLEAGVSKCVLFPMTNGAYGNGVAWQGITAINENPGGADLTDLYADNIKYASLRAAETFSCTIEAYTYPDEWAECDGSAMPETGVYFGQQPRKAFGLCYRTEIGDDAHPGMDKGYKLHFVYNSTVSPSSRGYATINNSPDAISFSWEASSTPTAVTDIDGTSYKAVSTVVVDSTKVDATKLATLEDMIYGIKAASGGTDTQAVMPTPNQIASTLA